eukprot:983870-Rhodomonas_salina.1
MPAISTGGVSVDGGKAHGAGTVNRSCLSEDLVEGEALDLAGEELVASRAHLDPFDVPLRVVGIQAICR